MMGNLTNGRAVVLVAARVHVGWRREDEFLQDRFRPPTRHQLSGYVGKDGKVEAMREVAR